MVEDARPDGIAPRCCLVLASRNPRRLADFYAQLVDGGAITVAPAGAITIRLPTGMDMVLYRPSRQRPQPWNRKGECLALCLRCTHLECTRQRAMALGAKVLEPLQEEAFGREQWLLDPEGNRVLLWEDPP
ncbi:MAG: VOC family protein [Synechococcus sp. SB0673_bin_10]|uniref:VOC family protein n=1 Tax=Synechococcus sp. SB0676_bin_10 TaxID=2604869 RepID=A0A6B1F7D0_9SYNE|nr:VOC family protein [Cyanobacteria bacterium MAG IRC4_bin_6]MXW11735.1 VOC family protein [Synechococcus sp. SB0668_bin_13]MXY19318.1 VOC family protein [Synechococcus sp. SB0664_bin_36]MXY63154.1 VOC family protein [Synechococcus sp. SB0665_bin_28]MYF19903.1 VOC family protein [Synechococcus sp. SB0677_bin_5]MYG37655.1 VOC family protein [Synechococcus sp. SB0676_bin_10]MYG64304.1 VOC family protein [Synechococcus sp. SB0675_bin_7]MYI71629.1 VOC family protein [Synechococcus sp. SB0673_bi